MKTFERLLKIKQERGAGYFILIDPDKLDSKKLPAFTESATTAGADAFLVGGSLMLSNEFDQALKIIKDHTSIPVIIFPEVFSRSLLLQMQFFIYFSSADVILKI